MTTQPNNVQPLRNPEQLVGELVDLTDQITQLEERAKSLRAQLVEHVGVGNTLNVNGVKVTVREPSRRFNLERAKALLTDDQLALATSIDAAKVKQFLPPVLLDQCMDASSGNPIVSVR